MYERFTYEEQLEVDLETTMAEYLRVHADKYGGNKVAFLEDLRQIVDNLSDQEYLDTLPF
jgi:hypothetical protein